MEPDWKPRWNPEAELEKLPLAPEDAFVLTRLDGRTSLAELPALTGLPQAQLDVVVNRLLACGALVRPAEAAPNPPPPPETAGEVGHGEGQGEVPPEDDQDAAASVEGEPTDSHGTHRKLYELELHPLPPDERAARAATAIEPQLSAFCYDPVPAVIRAVLTNPNAGLTHARLVAQHHRTGGGLEVVAARGAFAADLGVRRWLVRNPMLPGSLFTRLFGPRRMLELFRLGISREIPEQTRRLAREALRRRFTTGVAEERVELILKSEGRALAGLLGLPVDGRTTALLCARTYTSTTLIQNIARWAAAPPALIAHLLKQEAVRRSQTLRTLLSRHPNAPAEHKKG